MTVPFPLGSMKGPDADACPAHEWVVAKGNGEAKVHLKLDLSVTSAQVSNDSAPLHCLRLHKCRLSNERACLTDILQSVLGRDQKIFKTAQVQEFNPLDPHHSWKTHGCQVERHKFIS